MREGRGSPVNLEEILVELRIQHGNFRLDIFVQDQRKHRKHGVNGGVPGGGAREGRKSPQARPSRRKMSNSFLQLLQPNLHPFVPSTTTHCMPVLCQG